MNGRHPIQNPLRPKANLSGAGTTYSPTFGSVDFVGNKYSAILDSNAGGGTNPTLDVKLQTSYDGTTWVDVPSGAFTQVTASPSAQIKVNDNVGVQFRYAYTIGGTGTPNFTFGIALVGAGGNS
jgi:hypothetical protein